MTQAARLVLSDCRDALADLADGVQGSEWRRRWITAVVLLRAVGHVLHKVDRNRSDAYSKAIKEAWKDWQDAKTENAVFYEFIEKQRNSIVKEYELGAGQGVTIQIGAECRAEFHYELKSGRFQHQDPRDVVRDAIAWWEKQLDRIDEAASEQ